MARWYQPVSSSTSPKRCRAADHLTVGGNPPPSDRDMGRADCPPHVANEVAQDSLAGRGEHRLRAIRELRRSNPDEVAKPDGASEDPKFWRGGGRQGSARPRPPCAWPPPCSSSADSSTGATAGAPHEHLSYEKGDPAGEGSGNNRNGHSALITCGVMLLRVDIVHFFPIRAGAQVP